MDRITLNEDSQAEWVEKLMERLRFEYDLGPQDVVFDVGAYRGEFAEEIYQRYGSRIVAVEPTDAIVGFKHAEKIIKKAAGWYDGEILMGGAFLYTSALEPEGARPFPCFDLNAELARHPEVAVCKINIEGGEYQLLRHVLDGGLASRVRNFQVQFHQIEGEPYLEWYKEIEGRLEETHELSYRLSFCWENWERKK